MGPTIERRNPVHPLPQARETDVEAARVLALCDVSELPKLGVKGPGAAGWLQEQGIDVPSAIYDTRPLVDGGLIARLGTGDFLLEGGFSGTLVSDLSQRLTSVPQVYRGERCDATFLLTGTRSLEVLAQLCSIDFRAAPPRRVILTRAAGVNVAIVPDALREIPLFRLWIDPGFAVYFWESLLEIAEELGGTIIGAAALYPGRST